MKLNFPLRWISRNLISIQQFIIKIKINKKGFGNQLDHQLLLLPGFRPQEHDRLIFFAFHLINMPLEEQWQWQHRPPLTLTEFQSASSVLLQTGFIWQALSGWLMCLRSCLWLAQILVEQIWLITTCATCNENLILSRRKEKKRNKQQLYKGMSFELFCSDNT